MSGLVGWIDFGRDLRTEGAVLESMTETMRSRGPDGAGSWISETAALGHRRLATSKATGAQPAILETDAGTVAAAYDGSISNVADLTRELGAASDADVLLRGFLAWGDSLAERLEGMFAFAIWDGRARRLVLGRDRMGVKPLYYAEHESGVLFASEPKGILANSLFRPRLDVRAVPMVLQPRLALPGETPLAGLREVPPAHVVSFSREGVSLRRYWRLTSEPHTHSFAETAERVRTLLDDAVGRDVTSDVPCGGMLSGGVDSTAVAAFATAELRRDGRRGSLDTFCVQFEGDPAGYVPSELRPDVDAPYAQAAADFVGARHTTITATLHDLLDAVPATRRARDLPGWGQFDASMYVLFREMRSACAVGLTGEAADELFGGYPYLFKPELVRRDRFPWLGDGPALADCLSREVLAAVDPREDERARYSQLVSEVPRLDGEAPEEARMREVLYLGMSGPLAVILDRMDRMSMAVGLEMRVPFCDRRLVEYVWNVPWSLKCSGGIKGLLKAATADVLPPATLTRRKSAYPHVQSAAYDEALIREATEIAESSSIDWMFDTPRLTAFIGRIRANELGSSLPGGVSGAHLLIQLVEMRRWIDDYRVAIG